jgi:hypothetical protein
MKFSKRRYKQILQDHRYELERVSKMASQKRYRIAVTCPWCLQLEHFSVPVAKKCLITSCSFCDRLFNALLSPVDCLVCEPGYIVKREFGVYWSMAKRTPHLQRCLELRRAQFEVVSGDERQPVRWSHPLGFFDFYVDGNGIAGHINFDDWNVS